ncbi:MAG: Fic family protein [Desulfarculales bacterium]|jgi:Fic family protein|nr:Fic family protein [Desulfarculales bacterium]
MININTLHINHELLKFIAEIDEFKGSWPALSQLAPERLSALRRVATIESIGSSTRIEGSGLSDHAVEKLLNNLVIDSFTTRDEQEVAGYADTMEQIFQAYSYISLTENHIRQLHRDLLRHSDKDQRHRGNYKTFPNNVAAFDENGRQIGIVFAAAAPFATPALMQDLLSWTNSALETGRLHTLLVIGVFVVSFLAIHPFQDGNGRLSRILTTLLLLRAGYAYVPYSSLESVIENSKRDYYLALRQTQATINSDAPDWQPWLRFFLHALHQQMRNLTFKMEREHRLNAALPELSLRIMEQARAHGRVTLREISLLTGVSRNTLKEHFRKLAHAGHLSMQGKGRGTWYRLK